MKKSPTALNFQSLRHLMKGLLISPFFMLLIGCQSDYVKPTHYTDIVIHIWIRTDDVSKDCLAIGAKPVEGRIIKGCAAYKRISIKEAQRLIAEKAESRQSIILCTSLSPQVRYPDDDNTMTLGHESNHCFTGNYHE